MSPPTSPLERLVDRLDVAVTPAEWMVAACGIPPGELVDLADLMVAISPQARAFLDDLPHLVRHLVSGTAVDTERCVGQVRGPIAWSETIAAWSGGIGTHDVFICVSPRRTFDLAENRVVAWLLHRLARAPRRLDTAASMRLDAAQRAHVREAASAAESWRRHRYLIGLATGRPSPAELRKARTSRHQAIYEPALVLASRLVRPFDPSEALTFAEGHTADQIEVLTWLHDDLMERGHVAPWEVAGAALHAGELWFRHAAHFGPSDRGINLGGVMIDAAPGVAGRGTATIDDLGRVSAALSARAGSRPWFVVGDRSDARLAVQMALDTDPQRSARFRS